MYTVHVSWACPYLVGVNISKGEVSNPLSLPTPVSEKGRMVKKGKNIDNSIVYG